MGAKQDLDECSRRLDVLSRRVDNACTMWNADPVKAKRLLEEIALDAFRISSMLERLSAS